MAIKKCKKCGQEISPKLKICPDCGAATGRNIPWGGFLLAIFTLALWIYILSLGWTTQMRDVGQAASEEEMRRLADQMIAKKVFLPKYTVYDRYIATDKEKEKLILKIIVSDPNYTEIGLKKLLTQLYMSDRAKRGFYQYRAPRSIEISAYVSKEHAASEANQWLGILSYSEGDAQPDIAVNEKQIRFAGAPDEEKFGMAEDARIKLWSELVKIERQAALEAEDVYPVTKDLKGAQPEYNEVLIERYQFEEMMREKYKDELARTYNLKREQLDEIAVEAIQKDWPYPPDQKNI